MLYLKRGTLWVLLSAAFISSSASHSYEVDNFTYRYDPLKDSRDVLNDEVNRLLNQVQETLDSEKCSSKELLEVSQDFLGSGVVGVMEEFADESKLIQKHPEPKKNVYAQGRGIFLSLVGLNSSINLNGNYVGVDKLGHFFDQGLEYYQIRTRSKNYDDGIVKALRYGQSLEKGEYGLETTGIYSHADLAANFSGYQFWSQLYEGQNPYFKCQNGKWAQVRKFDFAEYANPAWDEGINCSKFQNPFFEKSFNNTLKIYEKASATSGRRRNYRCPVSSNECYKLNKLYGNNASYILHPSCQNAVEDPNEEYKSAQIPASSLGLSKYDNLKNSKSSAPPAKGAR